MSTEKSVSAVLVELRRRQRILNSLRCAVHGALAGGFAGCAGALIVWVVSNPGPLGLVWVGLGLSVAGVIAGALIGLMLPIQDLELARALDRASAGEDRFASAVQLAGHHRRERVRLVVEDALTRVRGTTATAALPISVPRTVRWLPLPLLALVALLALLPAASQRAVAAGDPEINAEEWAAINKEFGKELAQLPKPQSPEDQELRDQLQRLADVLKQNPDKKEALKEIAKLSDRIAERRRAVGARRNSMRSAAQAVASSKSLKDFAAKLKDGAYDKAASDLRKLSEQLKRGELAPDAAELESVAEDLQRLAEKMDGEQEMQSECQNCANAASSMNREQLAEALRRLAEQMEKNSKKMSQCDNLSECDSLLEQLKRMMNQCKSCQGNKPGEGFCDGDGNGAKRGGLKPGWGTAAKWDGGSLKPAEETRNPDLENSKERQGMNSTFRTISPDERAKAGKNYEELYAEFVQKTEADLELETVPVSYREYLKRYFNAIRPEEPSSDKPPPTP